MTVADSLCREKHRLIMEIKVRKARGHSVKSLARRVAAIEAQIIRDLCENGENSLVNRISRAGFLEDVDLAEAVDAYEEMLLGARSGLVVCRIPPRLAEWITERVEIIKLAVASSEPDLPSNFRALMDGDLNHWCQRCVLRRRILWGVLASTEKDARGSVALAGDLWYGGGECAGCGDVILHGGTE